jgi:hypothetical protein
MEPSKEDPELEEVVAVIEGAAVDKAEEKEEVDDEGVQIGPGANELKEAIEEESVGLELGDLIEIHSELPDLETVRGRIYYIDESRISLLEEGKSRKLVVIDLEQDEDGDWVPKEEYQLTGIEIKEKRILPSFVAQRGMTKDLLVETFTAEGEPLATYTIQTLDEVKDTATFVDQAGELLEISFEFKGIPKDRSLVPFDVLRVVEPPKTEETVPNEAAPGEVKEEVVDFEFLEDLEAPDVDELVGLYAGSERPAWLITYTDDEQINDMLRERIRDLDPAAQRSPRRIREVSRLVWLLLALRNDVTRYSGDKPIGRKPVAFETLVDLLEKTQFPLAKQVLSLAKAIYVDHSDVDLEAHLRGPLEDPISVSDPNIVLHYLQDTLLKGERYLKSQLEDSAPPTEGPGAALLQRVPRWISVWQGYFSKYFSVVVPIREDDDLKDVKYDQDVFRTEIPSDGAPHLTGFPVLFADRKTMVSASDLGKVGFSFLRVIGPRAGRYGEGGLVHRIEEPDSAELKGYLIFPLQFLRDMGATRSGLLALDIGYGLTPPTPLKLLLKQAPLTDIPEPGAIISVSFDGSTLGNTEISDWLKGQALYGGGIGDLMPPLRSFGLTQAEFTLSQTVVLSQKISLYQTAVRKLLKDLRDGLRKGREARKTIRTIPLLPNQRAYELEKRITNPQSGEEILRALVADFKIRLRSYSQFDVALFAYLYVQYPDFVLNALAQNPEVAKERRRVERDLFIRQVLNRVEEDKKLQDAGAPPTPNPCQHVKDLTKIRKIPNATERMLTLNKFIRTYKLKKEDHWLWCNNGDPPHHLICEHEYLLLQEFLHPKEKDVIHKELLLTFSGGKFNGQYICKQCGQSIQEYEYDTSLEFDDEGKPMSGRAVLVDEDALEEEKLQRALTTEAEEEERVSLNSEEELKIFNTLSELAALVGVVADRKSYETSISRVKNALTLVPDRTRYSQSQKALKKAGKPSTDYDIFINRILVSLCAGALLIDVQTHIPDYVIRYTLPGCANPQFTGYPKDAESGPVTKADRTGLEYLACAISSVRKKGEPWELTGYQSIASSTTRMREIMFYLETFTKQLAETPDVKQAIIDKKQYLLETFGYESALGRPHDLLPAGFTPVPFVATKELAAEAESPVVVETASEPEKVRAYIKQAHVYALKYGKYLPGAGFSEASCCYASIAKPSEFWETKGNLPELSPMEPPQGGKGSRLQLVMTPRPLERLFGKADASIMYRLFLRVCFKGPRIGEQHEPGYNNVCPWCDFVFPEDPRLPPPTRRYAKEGSKQKKYDAEYESALQEKERKEMEALRASGISEITKEAFEDLLTEVNRKGRIPLQPRPYVPTGIENLRGLQSLLPTPFEGYEEILTATLVALESLPPDSSRTDLINAFSELSLKAASFETELRSRLGDQTFALYASLVKLAPLDLGESLRSYILIPFQRILTAPSVGQREFKPLVRPSKTSEFSPAVLEDLKEAYARHTGYLNEIIKAIPKNDRFIKAKLKEVVDRLSIVIPVFVKILRPTVVKGGDTASQYLQRLIVGGIFAEFLMPNHVPSNEPGLVAPTSAITVPSKLPAKILQACLLKYNQEALKYSDDQIRELIQDRVEKEKAEIIKDKNVMTPEQRKLDNLLQRLGMGKWAVGGTKAIWRYDPNQYVSEKEAMASAGITRFAPQVDVYETEGGYDVVQTTEDNA